jgi:thiamine-monophosphate kinase
MAAELDFISSLRSVATHPAARGLMDDAAVLEIGGARLVITHDMLVEGVHFLPSDPPESVAWKMLAVNLSDLAAKGAKPVAALMGYALSGDADWDAGFVRGLEAALAHYGVALIGGDTVSAAQRMLGLTLIGKAGAAVPARSGARAGDALFVTGVIGDAGFGLGVAKSFSREGGGPVPQEEKQSGLPPSRENNLLAAYRTPIPQLAAGIVLAPAVTAMMDVSDGLLIDASRLAEASGCAVMIDLDAVPLSVEAVAVGGDDRAARLAAACAGDDYQLLFTSAHPLPSVPCPVTRIGVMVAGSGIHLHDAEGGVPLPARLGWLHGLP